MSREIAERIPTVPSVPRRESINPGTSAARLMSRFIQFAQSFLGAGRLRADLSTLNEHMLRDVGLTRHDVEPDYPEFPSARSNHPLL